MALDASKLGLTIAAATYQNVHRDMLQMVATVETEKTLQEKLLDAGVSNAEREAFELLREDQRHCDTCKTTCFLSAVTCKCSPGVLVCLRHYANLCGCHPENYTLRYSYALDELLVMLKSFKLKAESFERWVDRVKDALGPRTPKTLTLQELKALLNEAEGMKFPKCDLTQTLMNAVGGAEECARVIQLLAYNKKKRTLSDIKYKLTLRRSRLFHEVLGSLPCVLEEAKSSKGLLEEIKKFEIASKDLLEMKLSECSIPELQSCISQGNNFCIEFPILRSIKMRWRQYEWLNKVKKKTELLKLESIKNIIKTGSQLPPNPEIQNELNELKALLTRSEEWEQKAQAFLKKDRRSKVFIELYKLLKEAGRINSYLPSEKAIFGVMDGARDWLRQLKEINSAECYPFVNDMQELINKGHRLALPLVEVNQLEAAYLAPANAWKDKTHLCFLRRNSTISLMEAISPRVQIPAANKLQKQSRAEKHGIFGLTSAMDSASVTALFKEAEREEMELIRTARAARTEPNDSASYCVCRRDRFGLMMQCELCKDWFHSNCVPFPVASSEYKGNITSVALQLGFKYFKLLCRSCRRTKRPRLEALIPLLMSLQKLYVRVPEGVALQNLTERAMDWQDRARELMREPELVAARNKLNSFSRKYSDAVAKQGSEETISRKGAGKNPELHKRKRGISGVNRDETSEEPTSMNITDSSDDRSIGEHAYSSPFPKHDSNEYRLQIPADVKKEIEELLMEGDLLEVHLDESFQLWRLLQASRDPEKEAILVDFGIRPKRVLKGGRKRRSEEVEAPKRGKVVKSDLVNTMSTSQNNKENVQENNEGQGEDTCSTGGCLKPMGFNVDWVQCDGGCNRWFHMACVGLSAQDLGEDEDYFCEACLETISRYAATRTVSS